MKNGDKPIYPLQYEGYPSKDAVVKDDCVNGLTKREYFAGIAMQGLLSRGADRDYNPSVINKDTLNVYQYIGIKAVKMADELLKQLEL